MKKHFSIAFLALFISVAISAQTVQQNPGQAQSGKEEMIQTRKQSQSGSSTRAQTGRQDAMQAAYKNQRNLLNKNMFYSPARRM